MAAQTADDLTNNQLLDAITAMFSRQVDAVADMFAHQAEHMATKDDLKGFATKDDLKGFATKDDLKGFATKDDLKGFATKDDIVWLERKIDGNQTVNIKHHLQTRQLIGDLNRKYDHLREGLARAGEPI